jgi:HemY protein
MRWLVSLVVLAIVATALALAGRYDPGYVVLVYPPWRAELSFVSFLLLLVLLVAGAYVLTRLAILTLNLPHEVKARQQKREAERQSALFTDTLAAYLEGRYQEAEKLAARIEDNPARVSLAQVLAARSAAEMRAFARRDAHLAQARDSAMPLAALYAEAESRLGERDATGALGAIEAGKVISPAHTALLRLEIKTRQMLGQWDEVLKLAEQLLKANALEATAGELIQRAAHLGNIKRRADDDKGLLEYWTKLPEKFKSDPAVCLEAAASFARLGGEDTAVSLLEAALGSHWNEQLAARYGQIIGKNPLRQIERAEKWLTEHPRDGCLLMSLADLCAHEKLWGKAQSYAEASLAVAPNVDAHLALAAFKEQGGQTAEACRHLKQALQLCQQKAA